MDLVVLHFRSDCTTLNMNVAIMRSWWRLIQRHNKSGIYFAPQINNLNDEFHWGHYIAQLKAPAKHPMFWVLSDFDVNMEFGDLEYLSHEKWIMSL